MRGASISERVQPTAGPPRRPLTRVVLDIRGRDIYAVGVEERTI